MSGRTRDFGVFGARGGRGSEAVVGVLDSLAGGVVSPVASRRGLVARLRYLTNSAAGFRALAGAGVSVTSRTLRAWRSGRQRPSRVNLARVDVAYWALRRRNVARYLLRRLNAGGGTRVEIHPLDQSRVARPHQRVLEYRSLNIRRWDAIVAAWAAADAQALDDAWVEQIVDLGSQWGKYEYVTGVGFAA